jgi:hypothetical protein
MRRKEEKKTQIIIFKKDKKKTRDFSSSPPVLSKPPHNNIILTHSLTDLANKTHASESSPPSPFLRWIFDISRLLFLCVSKAL